jgi:two-component system nitrate/nitrite sensor histidine kinase NarX
LGDVENIQSKFPNDKYFELLVSELSFLIDFDRWTMQKNYQELLDERIRLSREIHDGFAQTLAFLLIQLKRILRFYEEKDEDKFITAFEESYQTLSESYIDIRESISSLRVAPEKDLITTLQPVLCDFEKKTKIPVEQSFEPLLITIPESAIFHIIRILQESLSNIRKHSEATSVEVRGCNQGNNYILIIKDNGIGFDQTDHENEIKDHIGIKSMVERAELIDGKLHIKSAVCAGTEIRLVL